MVKKHDSAVWTGVPRLRIFISLLDGELGGPRVIQWIADVWELMMNALSGEEGVVNHAAVNALAGSGFEGFVSATKAAF